MSAVSPFNCSDLSLVDTSLWQPYYRSLNLVLGILQLVYIALSYLAFLYYQRKFVRLQKRSALLVGIQSGGASITAWTGLFFTYWKDSEVYPYGGAPCIALLVITWLLVPTIVAPQLLSIVGFRNQVKFSRVQKNQKFDYLTMGENESAYSRETEKTDLTLLDLFTRVKIFFFGYDSSNITEAQDLQNAKSATKLIMVIFGLIALFFPFIVSMIIFGLVLPEYSLDANCNGCKTSFFEIIVFGISLIAICSLGIYYTFRMPGETDEYNFLEEARLCFIWGLSLGIPGLGLLSIDPNGVQEFGYFNFAILISCSTLSIQTISTTYQIYLSFKKEKTSRVQNGSTLLELEEIMKSPELLDCFEECLVSLFSVENIKFYIIYTDWKKNFYNRNEKLRNKRALILYKKFIVPDADLSVNISHKSRANLIAFFGNDPKEPVNVKDNEIFDSAAYDVKQVLSKDSIPKFMKSSIYQNYLNESAMVSSKA